MYKHIGSSHIAFITSRPPRRPGPSSKNQETGELDMYRVGLIQLYKLVTIVIVLLALIEVNSVITIIVILLMIVTLHSFNHIYIYTCIVICFKHTANRIASRSSRVARPAGRGRRPKTRKQESLDMYRVGSIQLYKLVVLLYYGYNTTNTNLSVWCNYDYSNTTNNSNTTQAGAVIHTDFEKAFIMAEVSLSLYIYIHIHIYMLVYVCIYMYIYIYICIYICVLCYYIVCLCFRFVVFLLLIC